MIDFKTLKNRRNDDFNRLNAKLKSFSTPSFKDSDEEKFWSPVVDPKTGEGFVLVRWMPTPIVDLEADPDSVPIVQWWSHGFEGPAGWYIEKSLTTFGEKDPCTEMNSALWASGSEADKKFVQGDPKAGPKGKPGSKRKENFASNLFILKHPNRPDDEGKIVPFKYGKMIFGKISEAQNPKNPMDVAFNPFDLWEGATFSLIIGKNEGGHRTYNASKFLAPGPLSRVSGEGKDMKWTPYSDEEMEALWKQCQSLREFVAPSKFKTYDQLKARLDRIMGAPVTKSVEQKSATLTTSNTKAAGSVVQTHDDDPPPWEQDADDSDDLASFKNLIKG